MTREEAANGRKWVDGHIEIDEDSLTIVSSGYESIGEDSLRAPNNESHIVINEYQHIFINDRELPECESYAWFEAAIQEKAAREKLDENGLLPCGCGGRAEVFLDEDDSGMFYARCPQCTCSVGYGCNCVGEIAGDYATVEQAGNAWNKAHGWRENRDA